MDKIKDETHDVEIAKEMTHNLGYVRLYMLIIGGWPLDPNSSSFMKRLPRFIIPMCITLLIFIVGPGIYYIFFKEKDSKMQLKLLPPVINSTFELIEYTIVMTKTKNIKIAKDEIRNDWFYGTEDDRQLFRKNSKIGRKMLLIIAITMYIGGIGFRTVFPILKGKIVLPNNKTMRLLPCPTYLPYINVQATPTYEIIFAVQIVAGFYQYTTFVGSIGTFAMITLHLCSLVKILETKIENLNDKSNINEDILQRNIVNIVEHHIKIKRFLMNGKQIIEYISFIKFMNTLLLTCMMGYGLITEWENFNISALVVYFVLIITCVSTSYMICFIGQLLLDESHNFAMACNTLEWYNFPLKKVRYLLPIIIMSNFPIKLTAMKMMDVSLATFTDIIKTSMGYLNMMREVI